MTSTKGNPQFEKFICDKEIKKFITILRILIPRFTIIFYVNTSLICENINLKRFNFESQRQK